MLEWQLEDNCYSLSFALCERNYITFFLTVLEKSWRQLNPENSFKEMHVLLAAYLLQPSGKQTQLCKSFKECTPAWVRLERYQCAKLKNLPRPRLGLWKWEIGWCSECTRLRKVPPLPVESCWCCRFRYRRVTMPLRSNRVGWRESAVGRFDLCEFHFLPSRMLERVKNETINGERTRLVPLTGKSAFISSKRLVFADRFFGTIPFVAGCLLRSERLGGVIQGRWGTRMAVLALA